ncbi:unnamed protein product [Choristocarpus tenellus]
MPLGMVNGAGGGNSPEELFRAIPPVSKVIIVSMVGLMIMEVSGMMSPFQYAIIWPLVWKKFHVWRIITGAFYPGSPGFGTLISVYMMGSHSIRYEKDAFSTGGGGGSADYALLLIFGISILEILSVVFFNIPFILSSVLFMVIYVWSRKSPDSAVSFWGVRILAVYTPWAMVGLQLLLGQSIFEAMLGIGVGHLYYFLIDILPDTHNIDIIQTPEFLVKLLGWGHEGTGVQRVVPNRGMPAPGAVPAPRDIPRAGRTTWGPGRTLGTS